MIQKLSDDKIFKYKRFFFERRLDFQKIEMETVAVVVGVFNLK
jgi:hypothetical protein